MNISLNLTLIIQIINFLTAYFFLSKFFLKPALELFKEDKNEKDLLKKIINEKKEVILNKENYKRLNWKKYQEQYQQIMPNENIQLYKINFNNLYMKEVRDCTMQEISSLVNDISRILKSKVINDC